MTVWWLECCLFCFFKQKTAYEMRISDWSSHVCSSDLAVLADGPQDPASRFLGGLRWPQPNQKAKRNQRLHLKCGLRPWLTRPFLQKRRLRRREGPDDPGGPPGADSQGRSPQTAAFSISSAPLIWRSAVAVAMATLATPRSDRNKVV